MGDIAEFLELISTFLSDNFLNKRLSKYPTYKQMGTTGKTVINLVIIMVAGLLIYLLGLFISKL